MFANKRQEGQALVLSIFFLCLFSIFLTGFFQTAWIVQQKIRLQLSADAAILSALNVQVNTLNTISLVNRGVLANDALAAQLNALVSESSFYRKMAEKFSRLLHFVPYAGAIANFLTRGIHTLEILIKRVAMGVLPVARLSNRSLEFSNRGIHHLFPHQCLNATKKVLSRNMPCAELHPLSHAEIIRQAYSMHRGLVDLDRENLERLRIGTMDKHTKTRNWRISIAGISPVKKTGGTSLHNGSLVARDKLKIRVFSSYRWKWKTVLSTKSDANDFGYRSPEHLLTLSSREKKPLLSLAIVAQATPVPFPGNLALGERKLTAVTAASLVYKRPSKPQEGANTFNPFWETRLIPVASEASLKKIIPDILLKEIRH